MPSKIMVGSAVHRLEESKLDLKTNNTFNNTTIEEKKANYRYSKQKSHNDINNEDFDSQLEDNT